MGGISLSRKTRSRVNHSRPGLYSQAVRGCSAACRGVWLSCCYVLLHRGDSRRVFFSSRRGFSSGPCPAACGFSIVILRRVLRRGPVAAPWRDPWLEGSGLPSRVLFFSVMAAQERGAPGFEALSGARGLAGALAGSSVAPWIALSGRRWPGRPGPRIGQPAGWKLFCEVLSAAFPIRRSGRALPPGRAWNYMIISKSQIYVVIRFHNDLIPHPLERPDPLCRPGGGSFPVLPEPRWVI